MSDRRALVTGASRGIGRACASALAAHGFDVVGVGRSMEEAPGILPIRCDMGDLDAVAAMPARAEQLAGGPFDVLVHCAGISRPAPITTLTLADWEESMRVNVTSAFVLSQHCVPAMVERGWGRIVTIGSLYSRMGARFAGPYAVSKHALLGLTRVLAMELATKGVTANCVIPGWTDTEMVRTEAASVAAAQGYSSEEAIGRFLRTQPLGRMVTTDEVAALVAFLCTDAAAAITGQGLNVDGGSVQS
jgi:NAD(P)-dependent dehydrogenase (short-subunit alcohol dehydrogenase family)